MVIPMTEDAYTTYMLNGSSIKVENTDFAVLRNKNNGNFDFTLNVFDTFNIVGTTCKTKEVLETLIKRLKPANSRVSINYEI
jgi:hypothetical protein